MAELKAFLREAASRPFIWGESDCILTGADWVREVEGWDPGADFRGRYDTEEEAEAWLTIAGGLVGIIRAQMRRPLVLDPREGDVGVVTVMGPKGQTEVTAICTGRRWAAKSPRGLWIGQAEFQAAWRVG